MHFRKSSVLVVLFRMKHVTCEYNCELLGQKVKVKVTKPLKWLVAQKQGLKLMKITHYRHKSHTIMTVLPLNYHLVSAIVAAYLLGMCVTERPNNNRFYFVLFCCTKYHIF